MVLKYLVHNIGLAKAQAEVISPQIAPTGAQTKPVKTKKRKTFKICLLFLVNIIVLNVAYSFWAAEENTPIWEAAKSNNLICVLWTKAKDTVLPKSFTNKCLMVTGILHTDGNSSALIGGRLVKEGDTLYGAKVVRINKTTVEFQKDDRRWKQGVMEQPLHYP